MPKRCIIPNCDSTERRNPDLSFFAITPDKDQKHLWIEAIEMNCGSFDRSLLDMPVRLKLFPE